MTFNSILDRGLGTRRQNALPANSTFKVPFSFLGGYQCVRQDEHISYGIIGNNVPPFGLAFSSGDLQHVIAVANEEGIIRIHNTDSQENFLLKEWLAHENAVFDIAWVPGEPQLVTAAGDQMARLWDVRNGYMLGRFKGHLCSLKSVSFAPEEKAVFCTGSRDGNIMVWDLRCSQKDGFYRQVKQISGAHNKTKTNPLSKVKERRSSLRGLPLTVDTQQSVTVVLFRDQHTLISSGAVDGVIKMWDLRKTYTANHHEPVPLQIYPYAGSSKRTRLGFSGLTLDSSRSNVMCNCTDDSIYMFNLCGIKTAPVAVFSGHQNSSFYVKSTISPDDQFLASGSSDNNTYIYKISDPQHPPMLLQGHSEEVTSVLWCPTDFTKIVSCSDDNTVRIWRHRQESDEPKSLFLKDKVVGWAKLVTPPKPKVKTERTPSKSQKTGTLAGLASPQRGVRPSDAAALPSPSGTTSPANAIAAHQKTPPSIKQWLSPACTPPGEAASPSCQVLSPCPQSDASQIPPAERRAKRRLETCDGLAADCKGKEECDCDSELYPRAKRTPSPTTACCTAQFSLQKKNNTSGQASTRQTGKENCSPKKANWLLELGQKAKKGQASPSLPKSPSGGKKEENQSTASSTVRSSQTMKKISVYFPTADKL